jgi:DNA-binding beta-propeller fold protein YncE
MKRVLPLSSLCLLIAFLVPGLAAAQDRVSVTFKVFPPEYELFAGGDRMAYDLRDDGLRVYRLPTGKVRVNLSAPNAAPVSLSLEVKPGMAAVQAKLEPRVGPLTLVGEAATGKLPRNLAFSADGKKLFVALQGEGGADVFDLPSLKKSGRLAPSDGATGGFTDVLTVGTEVWAVQTDGRVHSFDGSTLAWKAATDLTGGGNAFLTDLGGGKVAVANWDSSQVQAVDAATKKATGSLWASGSLRGFTARGATAWATLFDRGQVAVIDAATWKVKATFGAGKAPRPVAALGDRLFVGDMGSAQVLVFDAAGKPLTSVAVASNPHAMAVSEKDGLVAVASRGRNNPQDYQQAGPEFGKVTLLDAQGTVVGAVWGRNQPTGLAFSPDGRYLAFTDFLDNNVELYRVAAPAKAP